MQRRDRCIPCMSPHLLLVPSNQPIFLKMTTVEITFYWLSTIKQFIMSTVGESWLKVKRPPFQSDPNTQRCPSSRWPPSVSPPCVETKENLLSNRYTHNNTRSTQRWYYPQCSCDEMSCDRALLTPPQPSHFNTRTQLCGKEETHSHIWQSASIVPTVRRGIS